MRPVLLGGRLPLRQRSDATQVLVVWLPVAVMLLVIARESTALFGSDSTSHLFRAVWQAVCGPVGDERWPEINHILRKTGHFLGYGTLGLTWLRAWMLSWMPLLRLRTAGEWRGHAVCAALFSTMLVASFDELHQTYLPNRTGLPTDVLLDTAGAATMMALVALFWLRSAAHAGGAPQTNGVSAHTS